MSEMHQMSTKPTMLPSSSSSILGRSRSERLSHGDPRERTTDRMLCHSRQSTQVAQRKHRTRRPHCPDSDHPTNNGCCQGSSGVTYDETRNARIWINEQHVSLLSQTQGNRRVQKRRSPNRRQAPTDLAKNLPNSEGSSQEADEGIFGRYSD